MDAFYAGHQRLVLGPIEPEVIAERTTNRVANEVVHQRIAELEFALYEALRVMHRTNISKKEVADLGRHTLGYPAGAKLPQQKGGW